LLKFRIQNSGFEEKIQNYSRIPNYSEVAIPIYSKTIGKEKELKYNAY